MRRAAVLLFALAVLAGCAGGTDEEAAAPRVVTTEESEFPPARCDLLEPGWNHGYAICQDPRNPRDRGHFEFKGKRIPIEYPYDAPAGQWSDGFLRRDGRGPLLLQWTAECEVPIAFFAAMTGGKLRHVFGGERPEDWKATIAHGWTSDGKAIVEVMPGCSESGERAIWLVSPSGERRRLGG